jgi:hypothetical protein
MANFVKLCLFLCHLEIHDNNLIIRLCKITFYKKLVLKFEKIQTVQQNQTSDKTIQGTFQTNLLSDGSKVSYKNTFKIFFSIGFYDKFVLWWWP